MKVLVVDDDPELCELVAKALSRDGHTVHVAGSNKAGEQALATVSPEVVILDLDLPDGSGLELCRGMRRVGSEVQVLILTASGQVSARVEGLDAGADDYLVKPFAVAELRARVRALGRRRGQAHVAPIERGEIRLDLGRRRAWRQGLEVVLTAKEWLIVEVLARAEGRVVSRHVLLTEVWGEVSPAASASLGVLLTRIRRKLGRAAIRTIRGEGHALG
ncbi:MAG: response regulator transcription factor [Nannocystaceae bacterium]